VLSAISAYLKGPLPYWTFWLMALACFFIASFLAWRDAQMSLQSVHEEINRLRTPKYTAEQYQLVRGLYEKQDKNRKDLLKAIRLRGFMLENQATNFIQERTGARTVGLLNGLQYDTNLVCRDQGDQFRVNPEMQAALDQVLDEDTTRNG